MPGPFPRCPDGWRKRVKRAWDSIDQATIDKLVDAVPDRMAAIEEQGGEWLFRKRSKK
jgi:hypothetical protein